MLKKWYFKKCPNNPHPRVTIFFLHNTSFQKSAGPHTCSASGSVTASSGHPQGVKYDSGLIGDPIGYNPN